MNQLFGKSETIDPPTRNNDCINGVDTETITIEEKIIELKNKLRNYRRQLRKTRRGRARHLIKKEALMIMKKKKGYEQQFLDSLRNRSVTVEKDKDAPQIPKDTSVSAIAIKDEITEIKEESTNIDSDTIDVESIENIQEDFIKMLEEIKDVDGNFHGLSEIEYQKLESKFSAFLKDIEMDIDTSYLDDLIHRCRMQL